MAPPRTPSGIEQAMLRPLVSLAVLVLAVPAGAQVRLTDLSESGEVFRFRREPAAITVELRPAAAWDVLDFEVSSAEPGAAFLFRVPGATPSWVPTTSSNGTAWTASSVLPAAGELLFEVRAPSPRFLVRLDDRSSGGQEAPFYTYARFTQMMSALEAEPLAQIAKIGSSVQGRPLHRIVIDAPSPLKKKTVLMVVRQHGDEYGSSYILEGALDYLLSRSGTAPEPDVLRRVRWVIYPLVNPDGAFLNQRTNANGVDLNRDWDANGCNAGQQVETFAAQCDVEGLQALWGFDIGADHHGWGNGTDGGFRYAQGQGVSFVPVPAYDEARKDTEVVTLHDPTQSAWSENGGTAGMLRAEMFLRYGFLLHTPEYNSALSSPETFRTKGRLWIDAMVDTLLAPSFTDADGAPLPFSLVPGAVHVTVDDLDENQNAAVAESVQAVVRDIVSGDEETLALVETGPDTGIFRTQAALLLARGAPVPDDGVLQVGARTIFVRYRDDDYPPDTSTGRLSVHDLRSSPAPARTPSAPSLHP